MKTVDKRWEIIGNHKKAIEELTEEEIITTLLANRGLTKEKDIEEFLHPRLENVTIASVGIDKKQLKKAIDRIKRAIANKEQVVIYGDYDVDGIGGSAILWETLHDLGAEVLPYIPHRIDEGYGLSKAGISNIKVQMPNIKLIITIDNGIVAYDAVDFANKNGIDVIITDHHVVSETLPNALAIVHTTKLCGTGVGWMLSLALREEFGVKNSEENHLELVALATIADLVPLIGANRVVTKFGLWALQKTKRLGLRALFQEAGIDKTPITTYEVGHMIAPRLNAMGRLESAMDSLRLLCTKDRNRAHILAHKLASTNKERQVVTEETILHAKTAVINGKLETRKLLFITHETYQQGVIGLVAGKLVEEFYRPAIVISKGDKFSKASARSVAGFNIIEFIRSASEFLVDAGGHPMAAGFTVETEKLLLLQRKLEELAEKLIDAKQHITRLLRIDCEINFANITQELYMRLAQFEPFGMQNPQPVFLTKNVVVEEMRLVGQEGRHIKFRLSQGGHVFHVIAFGFGKRASEFTIGSTFDIAYTIDEDRWNGNKKLQLKIKDIKKS